MARWVSPLAVAVTVAASVLLRAPAANPEPSTAAGGQCPSDMARVQGFCIDRFEASMVDAKSGAALSPYYPPYAPRLERVLRIWQVERHRVGDEAARGFTLPPVPEVQKGAFTLKAESKAGVVPQAYLSHALAKRACENAGKRLCTEQEWVTACRGQRQQKYPYGSSYREGLCNVYRHTHPGVVLHGVSFVGHTDPRLNLVFERGIEPLLRLTGVTAACRSSWGEAAIYDMVGNLDEWIDDPKGTFVGGFYARSTREGCEAKISSHSPEYYDYSLGTRCCKRAG